MKANAFNRVLNYLSHIAYCFRNTRDGSYAATTKMALAYLGVNLHLFKSKKETRTLKFKDFDMDLDLYSREIAGFWEIFKEHQYLELPAPKDQPVVVLDVGANVGFFSIRQALRFRDKLKLIAFEPDPVTYSRLQSNIGKIHARTAADIKCLNYAVDSHDGEASFVQDVSVESHVAEGETNGPCITVQLTTLDSIVEREGISKIDLMKIDVEGHELKVLAGGAAKALPITENITMEYHQPHFVEEVTRILKPFGFRLVNHNQEKSIMSFTKAPPQPARAFVARDAEPAAAGAA